MDDDGVRLSNRDRVLACIVPLVLVLVAGVAVVRYHQVHQSSWQGVGFGMFATYEYEPARTIRATGTFDGAERAVPIPHDLDRLASRVLAAPGDPETAQLARELRSSSGADRLVVEVWGNVVTGGERSLSIGFRRLEHVEAP